MQQGLISVIVPVYKVEKYLRKCIDSIINQTYKNLEIILVDDGSPDNCGKICDEYAAEDSRIKVIHKQNGGLSDARNAGIEAASGEYLAFVDSDDYIASNMYEKLYNAIKKDDADISICNFLYAYEDGCPVKNNSNLIIRDETVEGKVVLEEKVIQRYGICWVVSWNKLYKRGIFKTLRFPVGKIHEDEFVFHLIYHNMIVSCISDALYYYVQRKNGNIMNSQNTISKINYAEAYFLRCEFYIRQKYDLKPVYKYMVIGAYAIGVCNIKANKTIQEVYKSILKQYRSIFKKANKCGMSSGLSIRRKLLLCMNYISPRLTYRLVNLKK